MLAYFSCFWLSADLFQNGLLQTKLFWNTIRVSNSLDPDQAQQFVGPDLSPNCLRKLSADSTSRQVSMDFGKVNYPNPR